jgi:predicted nucleotidyltransferase
MNSNNKKVISFFLENKGRKATIREISIATRLNYRIAYESVLDLLSKGILQEERIGRSRVCEFTNKLDPEVFAVEFARKEKILKNSKVKLINSRLQDVDSAFWTLLLFGSYAKGSQKKGSDIDLCLIYDNVKVSKKVEEILKLLPYDIHLLIFTQIEFVNMLESRKMNVGLEIRNANIILKGIENYYGILEHAQSKKS